MAKLATVVAGKKKQDLRKPAARAAPAHRPRILLVGQSDRLEVVRDTLHKIEATIDEVSTFADLPDHLDEDTIAVVVASPVVGYTIRNMISRIRQKPHSAEVAVFALVDDGIKDVEARRIYDEGATAVFEWPEEGLIFSRLVVELLAVDLANGTVTTPDAALARTIRARLKLVRGYGLHLRVRVVAGLVHLSGSVLHLWQKDLIEQLVSHIPGVTSIEARFLLVEPSDRTDAQIRRNILMMLRVASDIDETTLAVSVERGHVTLAGSVADRSELNRVWLLLANVRGVRQIDRLAVVSPTQKQRDHVAARRLQLMLSSLFPDHKVNVAIFAGVAVLSGIVERLSTRLNVQSRVEDDGAVLRVVNKIEVRSTAAGLLGA